MKRILLIILSILILSGCGIKEKDTEELKSIIVQNMDKIAQKSQKKDDYDYINNRYFRKIVKVGDNAIPIMINMYKDGELNDIASYVAAYAIQKISRCNIFEVYGLNWERPEEFFEIWKNNNCSYKDSFIANNVGALMDNYPEFSNIVKECKINLPIFKDMIPQGITVMNDYILITAYDNSGQKNSKCYVLNKNGEIKNIVTLDTVSHVGSVDYDEYNDLIWIPGENGRLNAYDAQEFLVKKEIKFKYEFGNLSSGLVNYQDSSKNQIAYLSIEGYYLYIGSFSVFNNGCVKKFQISKNENNIISLEFISEFRVPSKVQGITFYEKDDVKYMILSKSYGRHNSSYFHMYRYDEKLEDYTTKDTIKISLKLPPMLEQISMKDNLYAIFESNAEKFSDASEKVGNICLFDVNKVLDKFLEQEDLVVKAREEKERKEKEVKKGNEKKDGKKKANR